MTVKPMNEFCGKKEDNSEYLYAMFFKSAKLDKLKTK